mmetsp:Transcript_22280/g.39501  ORF Transcript_22280/g.39501 Transcript_22280/m.39501 type:complete len:83 (+) Transcript_22280:1221-1469(+)
MNVTRKMVNFKLELSKTSTTETAPSSNAFRSFIGRVVAFYQHGFAPRINQQYMQPPKATLRPRGANGTEIKKERHNLIRTKE